MGSFSAVRDTLEKSWGGQLKRLKDMDTALVLWSIQPLAQGLGALRPGLEGKSRRLEKREQRLLHCTFPVVPLSLPNANSAAALRRKLCPQCREKREGQESGSVSHGGQEGNRSPASTPAWRNSLRLLSPGARAVPSCRRALGRWASWEHRGC